jgi:FixJ family two-component response regulator
VTEQIKEIVYIVDDERIARYHLNTILQAEGYSTECFENGEDFLRALPPSVSGCALLDVSMPGGLNGPEIHRRLTEQNVPLPVVFVTAHATVPMAVDVMKLGALDVLTKPASRELLIPAVEKALALSASSRRQLLEQKSEGALAGQLTDREREVLSWIVEGKLNKEVAYYLGITERTVKAHRASIMEKLGMVSVAELVRFADRVGLSGMAGDRAPERKA